MRLRQARTIAHPLGSLLEKLSMSFDTSQDLSQRNLQVFKLLDAEKIHKLNFTSVKHGFKKLDLRPGIHLSQDDWEMVSEGYVNMQGDLNVHTFDRLIRQQLDTYIQRNVSDGYAMSTTSPEIKAILGAIKIKLMERERRVAFLRASGSFTTKKPKPALQDLHARLTAMENEVEDIEQAMQVGLLHVRNLVMSTGRKRTMSARRTMNESANSSRSQATSAADMNQFGVLPCAMDSPNLDDPARKKFEISVFMDDYGIGVPSVSPVQSA
mmetsp:Transcript_41150/g.64288  ORF Transcript_41150/g.64288 Transcript_41150/m.64288 type:complete len:268 (+) Transcript_41150:890-1693(+)